MHSVFHFKVSWLHFFRFCPSVSTGLGSGFLSLFESKKKKPKPLAYKQS